MKKKKRLTFSNVKPHLWTVKSGFPIGAKDKAEYHKDMHSLKNLMTHPLGNLY